MQLVPLLAWSGNGATQDMAKEFEWMLREFLLANLRGARRVDKSRISNLHARGQNVGRTEYIFVPQGAFYHARVCSDASLLGPEHVAAGCEGNRAMLTCTRAS